MSWLSVAVFVVAADVSVDASFIGVVDEEVPALTASLADAVKACGAVAVDVDVPAGCDDVCLQQRVPGDAVVVEVTRVGGDVDIVERAVVGGRVTTSRRSGRADAIAGLWLAPATCAAWSPPATTSTNTTNSTTNTTNTTGSTSTSPEPAAPAVHPGFIVAGIGALGVVVGGGAFAFDALVLEDPTTSGPDKARAAQTGWVWLGVATVSAVTLAGGAGWALAQ